MANKYLIETAIDVGIDNLKKLRNTDPKKLYDDVKKDIQTESSPEIKKLYQNYIDLYDGSVKYTVSQTVALGEEIKWKNLSDLKKAVESNGVGLSASDREGLNQFALVEYSRIASLTEGTSNTDTLSLLKSWFHIYSSLVSVPVVPKQVEKIDSIPSSLDATQNQKPQDTKTPETQKYNLQKSRGYALQELKKTGKTIRDLKAAIVMEGEQKLEINNTFDRATLDAVVQYQKDKKLPKVDGLVGPETIGSLWGVTLPIPGATRLPDGTPEPSRRPVVPRAGESGGITPSVSPASRDQERTTTIQQLSSAILNFRNVIQANADKVGITITRESIIEASQQSINEAYKQVEIALSGLERKTLSSENKKLYDAHVLEVSRYYAGEYNYAGINGKNRYWKNYDRSLSLAASLVADDLKNNKVQIPPVPTESSIRTQIKKIDPDTAAKFEAFFAKGYSWGDIMSNPKMRGAWDEIRDKVITKYDQDLQSVLSQAKKQYDAGQMTFKDDADGSRKKAFELMVDIMGAGGIANISHKSWDRTKDTGLIIGSAIAGTAATIMTGGWAGLALGAGLTTAGTVVSKGRYRDGVDGLKDTGFELVMNGVTFGAGGAIAKTGLKALGGVAGFGIREAGILGLEGAAGVGLSMAVEKTRAWYEGVGLSWTEAAKNSWYWAFLPLGIHYAGRLKGPATDLANRANSNHHRGEVSGLTPAVQAEARQIEADAAKLAKQVQAEQPKAPHTPPSDLPPGGLGIGSKVDPKKTPNPTEDAHPHVSPKNDILPETKTSVSQNNLEKALQYQFDTLKKEGDSVTFGNYTITRDGKNYRVKLDGEDGGSWIKSRKEAFDIVKSGLQKSEEQAQKAIDSSVKEGLKSFPQGKSKSYEWNGKSYTMKKNKSGDDIEVIGSDGKILAGKELDAFYASQAEKLIDLQKKSFFQAHGEKPIGEAIHGKDWYKFTSFDAWKKWHQDRSVLNPIKYPAQFARFSAEQVWDSLMAPIKTLDALKQGAMKDHWWGSDGRFNSTAKAIILRNANQDWFTWQSAGTIAGRGMALPVAVKMYDVWGQANPELSYSDLNIQWASVFYGGLIWGSLLSNSITEGGIPPNPFASSQSGAQVPSKQ